MSVAPLAAPHELEFSQHDQARSVGATPLLQRERILTATVLVVAEHGLAGASVARVTARARVSRRTFFAHFDGPERAIGTVIDDALEHVSSLVVRAFAAHRGWRDALRQSVADVLLYFDQHPKLARVLLVETLTAGGELRTHRQAAVRRFCALVAERSGADACPPVSLSADQALASVMGIAYTRMVESEHGRLVDLLGPLMGVLVAAGSDAPGIAEEVRRGAEVARGLCAARTPISVATTAIDDPVVPPSLLDPRSFRVRQCLLYVCAHPGSSNRQIGEGIGVSHRGQLSTLLHSLECGGVIVKNAGRPGHANSWRPTPQGRKIAHRVIAEPQ